MSAVDLEYQTHALEQVCEFTGAPSEDWLYRRIASGEFTAVLSGRAWRMTRSDMARVVDYMRDAGLRELAERAARKGAAQLEPEAKPTNRTGLSKRGAARMKRAKAA